MAAAGTALWTHSGDPAENERAARQPWPVTASVLIALLAMALTRRNEVLPVLAAAAIGVSQFSAYRLAPGSLAAWALRLLIYVGVSVVALANPPATATAVSTPVAVASQAIDLAMLLCMAELVAQFWQRAPLGGTNAVLILLSGFVFVAASKTYERRFTPYLTPAYVTVLVFALHSIRARAGSMRRGRMAWMRALLTLLALSIGFSAATFIYRYRKRIDRTGFEFVPALQQAEQRTVGFASSPALGEVQSAEKSMTRILRVEGLNPHPHLRCIAFYDYVNGRWDPPAENRGYELLAPDELNVKTPGPRVDITRLCEEPQFLFMPLHAAGLQVLESGSLQRDIRGGSALLFRAPPPLTYSVALSGTPRFQGPLCIPLDEVGRLHCTDVPDSIHPDVWQLAKQIAAGQNDPFKRAQAVEAYLKKNHAYSLTTDPGRGDPVSNFLLKKTAAHCEYFASASVILLRCLNIPSRYVTGFYAHEAAGARATIVRAQDAHAWAEAWIDGIGWMTIDATPPAGRPDVLADRASFWRSAAEWIADAANSVVRVLRSPGLWQGAVLALFSAAVAAMLFLHRRRAARGKIPAAARTAYSPAGDLGDLAAHFDALLASRNMPCPPYLTWQEHLALLVGAHAGGLDLEKARAFLSQYNAVRFGNPDDAGAVARLRALLNALES